MKNKLEFNKDDLILKSILTFTFSFLLVLMCLVIYLIDPVNSFIKKNITDSNLIPYAIFIILFVAAVVLFNYLLSRNNFVKNLNTCKPKVAKDVGKLIILISALVLCYTYLTEVLLFDAPSRRDLQYHVNEPITIIIVLGIFFIVAFIIESFEFKIINKKNTKLYFYLFVVVAAIAYGYSFYSPNCFSSFGNIHHTDAYFYSVYRTMMGVPRSYLDTGVYGYYSILLAPIVKILGGTFTSFFILIAILGGISLICMAYALDVLVKNPVIKVLGTIALTISIMSMGWTIYIQLYPHRTLFPSIMIAYMCYIYKNNKNNLRWMIGGYILSAFSIVWSTEIGIFCLISWVGYIVFDKFTEYSIVQRRLYKYIFIHILFAILSFISAIIFVNIVNLLMGGGMISLNDFLFPLLTSDYMIGYLATSLPKQIATWWVLYFGLFCVFFTHCIIKTKFNSLEKTYSLKDKVLFGTVLLGMGQLTYYINRAAWGNLRIVHYIVILLLCILADWSFNNYKLKVVNHTDLLNNIYKSITYITITTLVVVSLGGISNYYNMESYKNTNKYRDNSEVQKFVDNIEEKIPKDTRAFGNGIAELYSYLGWDSYYYIIDLSDITVLPDAVEYMNNELSHMETPILLDSNALDILDSNSSDKNIGFYNNNTLKKEFKLYDMKFYYYEPNN